MSINRSFYINIYINNNYNENIGEFRALFRIFISSISFDYNNINKPEYIKKKLKKKK